ncbi:MAG: tetratricopeptide repeat protein [Pyrinomonadaceae bacterium]|nr:tetratricopeptide repeat protein [Pyrinomonadaceae bacterium]
MYSNLKRRQTWTGILGTAISLVVPVQAQNSVTTSQPTASVTILDSTKDQDGLVGSVRRVKIQSAKLELKSGQLLEGPLQLLEITTYGLSGNRIDNASYPVAQSSVGKEEYKYNDKGNIIEMTLRGNDGSILSRENYEYEFDTFANWRKMVTSLVLFENGKLKHEPVEITYREIAYYFDASVAKMINYNPPVMLPTAPPKFPGLTKAVSHEIRPDISTMSELAKNERETLTRSNAEFNKAPKSNARPAAISLTPENDISAAVTRGTVPAPKETANSGPAARKGAVAYYEKGREYFDLGALNEAVESYQRSIELEPRSAEVYLSLGQAYLRLKKNQEAGRAFKQSTLLNPELAEAHYGLGLHYYAMSRHKNAADAFKRATLLRPGMAKAHYGLALTYQELGKVDALVAEFRILETLDRGLAKKLSDTVPEFNLPCRVAPFCK